jgi:hypothetical protein
VQRKDSRSWPVIKNGRASQIACYIRNQDHRDVSDFFGCTHAVERNFLEQIFKRVRVAPNGLIDRGFDSTGASDRTRTLKGAASLERGFSRAY